MSPNPPPTEAPTIVCTGKRCDEGFGEEKIVVADPVIELVVLLFSAPKDNPVRSRVVTDGILKTYLVQWTM